MATDWISVTLDRPTARLAMNGKRPFCVKQVAFKTCAAPSMGQKMYGRISTADGAVFDNSYIGNTFSWQKAASVLYVFQAIQLHFDDDGGSKLRAWLVSGGPFYFTRGGGGKTQSARGDYDGKPTGYIQYVQVAQAPQGLKVARDASDPNKVNFVWSEWDIKKNPDECGDSTSLMGYCVQVARDAAFTDKARLLYVSKGIGEAYGLYKGYDWYFRIATRNEVSEKYKLPGGQWSDTVKLDADLTEPATPDGSAGNPSAPQDPTANTDTAGSTQSASGNNPNSSGNASGTPVTTTAPKTVTVTDTVVNTVVKGAKDQTAASVQPALDAAAAAHSLPTANSWNAVKAQLNALEKLAITIRDNLAAGSSKTKWTNIVGAIGTARSAVNTAVSSAAATQTAAQKLGVALKNADESKDALKDAIEAAIKKNTSASWAKVGAAAQALAADSNRVKALVTGATATKWGDAATKAGNAATLANTAAKTMKASNIEEARAMALAARVSAASADDNTVKPTTDYSAAEDLVDNVLDDIVSALASTPEASKVTRVVTIPAGATVPPNSTGSSGSGNPSDAGTVPIGDGTNTDSGTPNTTTTVGGSTPTTTTTTTPGGTTTTQIVYTPIPDTSALRSTNSGLLISQTSSEPPGHTVYLMDRGGRQRVGEFKNPTVTQYNRVRDDQSLAYVTLTGDAIEKNQVLLDALAVGRHELCIYRGRERVWEGPLTLATFRRDTVELRAHDILHYLNRTVLKNAYSNAYPALDFVVNRIAGIIASELSVKEALDPPVNILPFMRTYVQDGDARTTRVTLAAEATVWQHLDDLAAKAGLDYTVIGRALHIWDTSRAAMGRLRTVTENDFLGDTYIAAYGMELATQTFVSDGQGNFGRAGGIDDYYGEIDLLATAYDENGNAINQTDLDPTNDTIPIAEMTEQAVRNLKGRNPTPLGLKVPDGSSFRLDRGIGLDVLIPGVSIPVSATLAGRTLNQTMKLKEVKVIQDASGEAVSITVTPAAQSDEDNTLEDA